MHHYSTFILYFLLGLTLSSQTLFAASTSTIINCQTLLNKGLKNQQSIKYQIIKKDKKLQATISDGIRTIDLKDVKVIKYQFEKFQDRKEVKNSLKHLGFNKDQLDKVFKFSLSKNLNLLVLKMKWGVNFTVLTNGFHPTTCQ